MIRVIVVSKLIELVRLIHRDDRIRHSDVSVQYSFLFANKLTDSGCMESLGSLSGLADKDERLANVFIGLSYFI